MKLAPVRCTRCGEKRYPRGAYATPYVCERCVDVGDTRPAAPTAPALPPSADPFHNDLARRAAINAASSRGPRRWLERRPGWLRRTR